jgi:hypothetical protein
MEESVFNYEIYAKYKKLKIFRLPIILQVVSIINWQKVDTIISNPLQIKNPDPPHPTQYTTRML